MTYNKKRLAQIAQDEDFQAFVAEWGSELTRKVMSATTSPEDREKALTKFHVLKSLAGKMASVAHDVSQED